jgi:hypothetical protein
MYFHQTCIVTFEYNFSYIIITGKTSAALIEAFSNITY